jgi:splicing factor 3B subunit 3
VTTLHTQGDRIIIGDVQESIHYAVYKHIDNRIIVFADDTTPRWLSTSTMVDYETVAGGDKFGNFFINRLPTNVSDEADDDPAGGRLLYEKGYLGGASHRVRIQRIDYYHGFAHVLIVHISMVFVVCRLIMSLTTLSVTS